MIVTFSDILVRITITQFLTNSKANHKICRENDLVVLHAGWTETRNLFLTVSSIMSRSFRRKLS